MCNTNLVSNHKNLELKGRSITCSQCIASLSEHDSVAVDKVEASKIKIKNILFNACP